MMAPAALAQESPVAVSVSAQPLGDALMRLGEQANLQIFFLPDLVRGLNGAGVSGTLTPDEALRRLLSGTGIAFRRDGRTVSLSRTGAGSTQSSEATRLSPVLVRASADPTTEGTGAYTATGPSASSSGLALSLRETPQSVSVMTSQRMKDQGLTQLTDVVNQTAGLVVNQSGNVGSDSSPIYSRGFTIDNYMVDGVKQLSTYSSIFQSQDMSLYDRVEIVRGAAGLMNGMGSPGGSINMIRKRPLREFQADLSLRAGSWAHKRGLFDISSPLNESGTLRGRLVAMVQDSNSYLDRFKDRRKVFYGVIEGDLTPDTVLRAGISHQRHDLTGHARGGLPAYASDGTRMIWSRSDTAAPTWSYSRRHVTSVFAELDHRFRNGWQMALSASRTQTKSDELVGYASGGNPNRATGAGVTIWASRWFYEPKQDVFSAKANGSFEWFGREHDAAFGASFSRAHFSSPSFTDWYHAGWSSAVPDIFNWDGNVPAAPPNPSIGTHGSDERNYGAFASLRLRPTDQLSVIVGTRYIDWSRDQTRMRYATGGVSTTTSRAEREFVPYAGLVFDLSEHWSAYASYTKIFTPQNFRRVDGSYIDPLSGDSYELGVKGAFFDDRLNVAAAVYDVRENNKAIAIPNVFAPDGSQAYEGKSGTRTRGFEVEVSGMVQPGWELAASYAQNRTVDRSGSRLNTNVPQRTVKLFTSYQFDGAASGLTLGGGVRWQSKIYSDNMGPARVRFTQPSYFIVDAMARYRFSKQLTATLNVHNLFDKHYYQSTGNSYYGTPRAFMLSLDARF